MIARGERAVTGNVYLYSNMLIHISCGTNGKEPACQCKRHKRCGFDPWVRKIPWRRAWQPIPVFLPGDPVENGAWNATVHGVKRVGHD